MFTLPNYPFAAWRKLASEIDMPADAVAAAESVLPMLLKDDPFALVALVEAIRYRRDKPEMLYAICNKAGVERDLGMMTICLLIAPCFREDYLAHDLSPEIYIDSMRDIRVWSVTCYENRGHWGLYQYSWVRNFFYRSILRLGRLEFHQIAYEGPTFVCGDTTVQSGDRVINIHIPADGPFPEEAVLDSFRRAYDFFGQTGWAVFHCGSWLLYEGNRDFMKPDSNICRFMDHFHIVASEGRADCGDLWRIFGVRDSYAPENLPRKTSLQKALAAHIGNGGTMGSGLGLFLFDGKTIR